MRNNTGAPLSQGRAVAPGKVTCIYLLSNSATPGPKPWTPFLSLQWLSWPSKKACVCRTGQRISTSLHGKPQGFFISAREPVRAGYRLEANIGLTSEPFVPSCKVAGGRKVGPQSSRNGSLPPSTHLSLRPLGEQEQPGPSGRDGFGGL